MDIGKLFRLNSKQKKQGLFVVAIVLVLGMIVLPTVMAQPTGEMSAGFMKDGEKVGTPLQAFVNPAGVDVDAIWFELKWTIVGEFVDWTTFHIEGSYGIDLYHYAAGWSTIFEESFVSDGEEFVHDRDHIAHTEFLDPLLAGQPYSASDANVWHLVFWGEFATHVESSEDGHLLYDHWPDISEGESGTTPWLTVYWTDAATFGGSGTVSTATA